MEDTKDTFVTNNHISIHFKHTTGLSNDQKKKLHQEHEKTLKKVLRGDSFELVSTFEGTSVELNVLTTLTSQIKGATTTPKQN